MENQGKKANLVYSPKPSTRGSVFVGAGGGEPTKDDWDKLVDKLEKVRQEIYDMGDPIKFEKPEQVLSFINKVKMKNKFEGWLGLNRRPDSIWCRFPLKIRHNTLHRLLMDAVIHKSGNHIKEYNTCAELAINSWRYNPKK